MQSNHNSETRTTSRSEMDKENLMHRTKKDLVLLARARGIRVDDDSSKLTISNAILAHEKYQSSEQISEDEKRGGIEMVKRMKSKTGGGWLKSPSSEKKEDSGNRYVALFETWDRFSNAMGTEMANMVEEGQNKYGALNNQWLELYQKTANDMAKSMQNGDVAEIQVVANVWKNYNSRLLSQMNKIIEEWSNAQNTIQKTWQTYVPKIGEQLLKTTKGTNEDLRVDDLFKTWTDFSAHMGQDFLTLVDAIISDSQDVMGIWNELDNEMKGQIESTRALNQGVYTELNKNWTETSERMGAEINKFMKDYTQRYKELRITWLEYASTMVKQFVNVINVGSPDFEDMYKTYMDRTYQFLRMLNPSMMTTASLANEEIRELRKKVEELEKRIGNTRTD